MFNLNFIDYESNYEERKAKRIERYKELAEQNQSASEQQFRQASKNG